MAYVDFVGRLHTATKRDYVQRVVEHDKAECAEVAIRFGEDYWDGERRYGYGGYRYDGRWRVVAEAMKRAILPGQHAHPNHSLLWGLRPPPLDESVLG